jgi:uncharacterized iron-regulated protein
MLNGPEEERGRFSNDAYTRHCCTGPASGTLGRVSAVGWHRRLAPIAVETVGDRGELCFAHDMMLPRDNEAGERLVMDAVDALSKRRRSRRSVVSRSGPSARAASTTSPPVSGRS